MKNVLINIISLVFVFIIAVAVTLFMKDRIDNKLIGSSLSAIIAGFACLMWHFLRNYIKKKCSK